MNLATHSATPSNILSKYVPGPVYSSMHYSPAQAEMLTVMAKGLLSAKLHAELQDLKAAGYRLDSFHRQLDSMSSARASKNERRQMSRERAFRRAKTRQARGNRCPRVFTLPTGTVSAMQTGIY